MKKHNDPHGNGKYQGYANWHTWNVCLWLNNDYESYKQALSIVRGSLPYDMPSLIGLRALAYSEIPHREGVDYDSVNWSEVYDNFRQSVDEGE